MISILIMLKVQQSSAKNSHGMEILSMLIMLEGLPRQPCHHSAAASILSMERAAAGEGEFTPRVFWVRIYCSRAPNGARPWDIPSCGNIISGGSPEGVAISRKSDAMPFI